VTSTDTLTGSSTQPGGVTSTDSGTATGTAIALDGGAPQTGDPGSSGRKDGSVSDGPGIALGHSGCGCDLGGAPVRGPGTKTVLGLLGAILVWRRTRKRR
jgi:hypothetical protein